jgi:hypothetical protein
MNKRSPLEPLEALLVLLPGAVGLYIVARAFGVYFRQDLPATVITVTMGLALVLGLLELLLRQRRATRLLHEVHALPASPSEATLDAASAPLSALLRARLEQAPVPNLGESVAPFLTGLLVMLGLLGTLLGLFETVRGAGMALTSSTDVDALRRTLSAPIEGLTRSFGCSAAGISASAMLGLAVALVRRRESRVLRAVLAYASGPLRILSPLRRQARALEQLAGQGSALPDASVALDKVGKQLGALADRLVSLQETGLAAQQRALGELLTGLRTDLSKVAAESGSALHERVAPLLKESLASMNSTVERQALALSELARDLTRELTADASTRRAEATEWVGTLGARIDAAERARSEAHGQELASLTALASTSLRESEGRERALEARFAELTGRLDAQLEAVRADEAARLSRLDTLGSSLGGSVEALTSRVGGELDTLAQRIGEQLVQLSTALGEQHEARRASEQLHDERARDAAAHLEHSSRALGEGIARQEHALTQLVTQLPPLFSEAAAVAQKSAETALHKLVDGTDARLSHVSGALAEHIEKLVTSTDTQLAQVSSALAKHVEKLAASTDARLERVSSLLHDELTERLASESAHDERARAALFRLEQSAGLLDQSIARQGSGVTELVTRVSDLLAQLTTAAQERAEATLSRLAESADEQATRFLQLSTALEAGRAEHARGLEDQLSQHAVQLEERLGKTSALVQDAAASWQASTVEMQAVADLFAKSVDRQREASDAWLESLGEVEGAVERAGRHAARDALSDQLASTQEVFARQLQFQRELFEQLRSLRTVTPRSGAEHGGEHDVSV